MANRLHSARAESGESGYAMLLVFLMAAVIAISLYTELPRVAFEAQRSKEQLLVERGEQYKRAIQLFVRKLSRYPATIEELENTNNIRFLRKRYVDPMTGKEKWRLIHINGGVLTDSIIPKNRPGQMQAGQNQTGLNQPGQNQPGQNPQEQQANTNNFIAEGPVMGAANDPTQQQANPALRRRASDDRPVATVEAPEHPQPEADQSGDVENDNSVTIDSNDNGDNNDNNVNNDNGEETPAATAPNANVPPGVVPNQPGMYPPGTSQLRPGMINPAQPNQPYGGRFAPGTPGGLPNQMANPGASGGFPQPTYPGQTGDTSSSSGVYAAPGLGQAPNASPGPMPAIPGQQPGMLYPNQPQQGFPGQPGMGYPNQPQQGFPGQAGMAYPNQPQTAFPGAQPTTFGQPAMGAGGVRGGVFTGSAGNLPPGAAPGNGITMGDLGLNGPRPGGMQGLPGMGGAQMGGGIAGVASESKGPSIMVYGERKKYNEWEFVYDQSKDRGLAGVQRGGGAPGTPAGQLGSMPLGMNPQQSGTGAFGQGNSPFGNNGIGQPSTGFGQPGPQQPQPQPQPQQPPN